MKFIFFSIIAVVALVAAVIAFRYTDTPAPTTTVQGEVVSKEINVKTADVLMARTNIPVGTIITSSMIEKQPWPENLIMDSFVTGDQGGQEIVGKVARSPLSAHEPFMKSKLANPNDPGFLAAALPTGMRAITIATDVVTGIAGFIFPGDRVDILYTHENLSDNSKSAGKPDITEVLGSNIRVLAVNLREGDPNKPNPVSPANITLEVTDSMAQLVRLAEKNGTLSFSLRSIHDDNTIAANPSNIGDLSHTSGLLVVRGPGNNGGKITAVEAMSSAAENADAANVAVPATPAANGAETAPAAVNDNQVNNNKVLDRQNNAK